MRSLGATNAYITLRQKIFWWKSHRGTGAENSVFCASHFTNARYLSSSSSDVAVEWRIPFFFSVLRRSCLQNPIWRPAFFMFSLSSSATIVLRIKSESTPQLFLSVPKINKFCLSLWTGTRSLLGTTVSRDSCLTPLLPLGFICYRVEGRVILS
jgi:hypothetical protein